MKYAKLVAVVLVVGLLFVYLVGPQTAYLLDWSSAQLVGYNIVTLIELGIALFIIKLTWDYTLGKKSKAPTTVR